MDASAGGAGRRSIIGLAVGVLTLGLVPGLVAPASAAGPSPAVTYIDRALAGPGSRWLRSAAPDGQTPVALTPSSYRTYAYDVSQDGSTLLVGVAGGASLTNSYDRTYGLVLVRRSGAVTTSRVLTNNWDTWPRLSADGSTAWWLTGGKLWKHTTGVTSLVSATLYAPLAGEEVWDLAVSPDGTNAAVLYVTDETHSRVLATDMVTGRAGLWFENLYTVDQPTGDTFVWLNDSDVMVSMSDGSALVNMVVSMSDNGISPGHPPNPSLDGFYDVRPLGSDWWMWKDDELAGTTSYGTTADPLVAPTSLVPRSNGPTTVAYTPSLLTPPALTSAANRARTYPYLYLSASTTTTGKRLVYASWALYLHALPGESLATNASEVDRGILQYSYNGTSWSTVGWTSWARPVPWPGQPGSYGNSATPILTRNTWFRWVFPGDYLTAPSTSVARAVKVAPIVTVSVYRYSSGLKRVYGKATRVRGVATIYRYSGGTYRKVASALLGSTGAYSFGARSLSKGSYRVFISADASWSAAYRNFAI